MAGSWSLMLLLLLLNGGGRDLLDGLSSQGYWQNKAVALTFDNMKLELGTPTPGAVGDISAWITEMGSDEYAVREAASKKIRALGPQVIPQLQDKGLNSTDSEVVDRARQIIDSFTIAGKAKEVRRLMAIRALGELKNPDALPLLRPLVDSPEPFVAEYARNAIATLNGQNVTRPVATAQELQADLNLLPAGLGAVAQEALDRDRTGQIDGLIDQMVQGMPRKGLSPAQLAVRQAAEKNRLQGRLYGRVVALAEKIGNVRLDALTVGVARDIGPTSGYVVLVARGCYDPPALRSTLEHEMAAQKVDELTLQGNDWALLTPSPHHLILLAGPSRKALPVATMADAAKTGKGDFATDADMAKLVARVDTTKPVWAALQVTDPFRQAPPLAPFDTLTGVAQRTNDGLQLTVHATGTAAEAVKTGVDNFNKDLAESVQEFKAVVKEFSAARSALTFLSSIKCEAHGTDATLTALLQDLDLLSLAAAMGMQDEIFADPEPDETPADLQAISGRIQVMPQAIPAPAARAEVQVQVQVVPPPPPLPAGKP